jgi:hypothetical protein
MQAGSSDLGNLPGTADGIGLHHHRRGDHQDQGEGEDATPTDQGTADDVGKEEHCGNQGSESGQLGGASLWGDDIAEQLASEDQLNGRTGNRPHDHRCGPGECEHDKPPIPPTVRPDHAPEGQSAREQHIAGVAEHPVRPERQIKKILDHLLARSLGKTSCVWPVGRLEAR